MTVPSAATIFAPAKVNLYLHVGPVQPDGRHPLDSLVVFADHKAADRLAWRPSDTRLSLIVETGAQEALGPVEDNLIMRAARLLEARTGRTFSGELLLDKRLPVAAGIGGGSSDAAACLHLLNAVHALGVSKSDLIAMSVPLGGDVPACVAGEPVLMRGDGDRLEVPNAEIPSLFALLVTPPVLCPTGPVFRGFDAVEPLKPFKEMAPPSHTDPILFMKALASEYGNDLQCPAIALHSEIHATLERLQRVEGARFTAMSGSGATCFALFENEASLLRAEQKFQAQNPAFWVAATKLGTAGFDLSA